MGWTDLRCLTVSLKQLLLWLFLQWGKKRFLQKKFSVFIKRDTLQKNVSCANVGNTGHERILTHCRDVNANLLMLACETFLCSVFRLINREKFFCESLLLPHCNVMGAFVPSLSLSLCLCLYLFVCFSLADWSSTRRTCVLGAIKIGREGMCWMVCTRPSQGHIYQRCRFQQQTNQKTSLLKRGYKK